MALLASVSDEPRLRAYATTGVYPALGNITRHVYLIRRFDRIIELVDEFMTQEWCIYTRDRSRLPETDHVIAMRNMIEGEEVAFRRIGIVSEAYRDTPCDLPQAQHFLPIDVALAYASHLRGNDAIGDITDAIRQHEDAVCAPLGRERRRLPEHVMRRWGRRPDRQGPGLCQPQNIAYGYEQGYGVVAADVRAAVARQINADLRAPQGPVYAFR